MNWSVRIVHDLVRFREVGEGVWLKYFITLINVCLVHVR
jgi:hypothetical protein